MIVFIYGEHFAVEVSHEQAHPSVITVSNAGGRCDVIEFPLATIGEQEIGDSVVAHPKVHQSIVVDVGRHHPPYLAEVTGDSRLAADVSERAVTIVVEQPAGHGRINLGNAVVKAPIFVDSAGFVQFLAEIYKAPDE